MSKEKVKLTEKIKDFYEDHELEILTGGIILAVGYCMFNLGSLHGYLTTNNSLIEMGKVNPNLSAEISRTYQMMDQKSK